ncbi:MAG TPA: hypothetical protein VNE42_10720 [Acidimicrobiales bacterium]|nr:hypothetical protein [Acidimicrobiales bacterium]
MCAELGENIADAVSHGVNKQEKLSGNRFYGLCFTEYAQFFDLASREFPGLTTGTSP